MATYTEDHWGVDQKGIGGKGLTPTGPLVSYEWVGDGRTINDLMVWHDCQLILAADTVAPGQRFGWRPSGVRAHTLVQVEPLTLTASLYWPDCCGLHGFITDGTWRGV